MSVAYAPSGAGSTEDRRISPLDVIEPARWQDQPVPERRWLIPGLVVRGSVTMLNGDGGIGKSLLCQQLQACAAVGEAFLGLPLNDPINSIALYCEDDDDELHYRQECINRYLGVRYDDLHAMRMISRVGMDNELVIFDRRTDVGKVTVLYNQILTKIRELRTELVIIDTVADTFMGNENIRPQVRKFVNLLRKLAMLNDGGVILTAHPSMAGLNLGTGVSGSTAWNNSVRGRLYLTKPKPKSEDDEEDHDARLLKTMKSNYSQTGGMTRLRWRDGVFVLDDDGAGRADDMIGRLEADKLLVEHLADLVRDGVMVAADTSAKNSLVGYAKRGLRTRTIPWRAVVAAQARLIDQGRIERVELGPPSKRRVYVRPQGMRLPGEPLGSAEA